MKEEYNKSLPNYPYLVLLIQTSEKQMEDKMLKFFLKNKVFAMQ